MTAPPQHAFDQKWDAVRGVNGLMKPLRTKSGLKLHPFISDPELPAGHEGVSELLFFSAGENTLAPGPSIYLSIDGGVGVPVIVPRTGTAHWDRTHCETFSGVWLPKGFRGGPAGLLGFYSGGEGWSKGKRRLLHRVWWEEGTAWDKPDRLGPCMGPDLSWELGKPVGQGVGAAWEDVQLGEQSVIARENVLDMLYAANDRNGIWSIGYAFSPNSGETWAKHPKPVIEAWWFGERMNMASHPCIRRDPRGGYHLWCSISGPVANEKKGIFHFWCADVDGERFLQWHPNPKNPVLIADPGCWIGMPTVKLQSDRWCMCFGGQLADKTRELWTARAPFGA